MLKNYLKKQKIFDNHLSSEFDKDDVMIGHSYFLENDSQSNLAFKIKPLLLEYVKDGIFKEEAKEKIDFNNLREEKDFYKIL